MLGKVLVYALTYIICVLSASSRPTIQDIKELSDRFLVNYSKHIVPSSTHDHDNPFNITIYVDLEAIGGIDELEEKLSTVLRVMYLWTDESIHWNLEDTNVTYITLGWSDVWKPVLRVTNPQTDSSQAQYCDRSYETVIFNKDGQAYFEELVTTKTTCDMDMSYYPFDVQTCEIKMKVIESSKFWFNLTVEVFEDFDPGDMEHGSWDLKSMTSSAEMGTFVIKLVLKRRPLFLLLNIVLPLYILALLTPVVFLLPKKSGERVGYSVAMLLAISVYMTIVSEHLPHNSNPAPLLPIMVFTWYIFDAVIVLIVIINTKIYLTTPNTPVPANCSAFVRFTRKLVCQDSQKVTEKSSVDEKQNCIGMETVGNDRDGSEGMYSASFEEEEKEEDFNVTWQKLSHAIDKWCFVISYIVKIVMPVIFFIVIKAKSQA